MIFEISDVDALGRIGLIRINNKEFVTPNLFPVIHPFKNVVTIQELKNIGVEGIFTNAYIIYNNESLRIEVLKEGIHEFLNYDGLIATDSGAFQQYMYNDNNINIDAETIEKFQEAMGSDFPVILDIPLQLNDSYNVARIKLNNTITRAKENLLRRTRANSNWFGPIHGGQYSDLLKECCIEMNKLDFAVYAIGGLVKAFVEYRFDLTTKILITTKKYLTPEKPIHMFGLGLPQYFSLAIACGCDLMDSAAYILYAREGRYFTLSSGTKKLEELEEFPCHCPICTTYTPKEVKESEDNVRINLLSKHNLYLSFSELRTIRQAIREGNLWELVELRIRNHPRLVKAINILKRNAPYIELYEKLYKTHGRLYSSSESIFRPDFYRYKKKLFNYYRPPKNVNVMIILPELDIKGVKSPSIKIWLTKIYDKESLSREDLHVYFFSAAYGVIPEELIDSYPLGQYETIIPSNRFDSIYNSALRTTKTFLTKYSNNYEKCYILIPETFINEFDEICQFPKTHPINRLTSIFNKIKQLEFTVFNNIDELIKKLKIN
jgi:7-cyano-7-deazaguanine tRNA-ribosyltransferase